MQPQSLYTSHKVSCTEGRLRRGLDCAWLPLGSFSTSVVLGFGIEPSVTCRFSAPLACITAFWIALPNRACAPNFDSFSEPAFTASLTDGRRRRGCRVVSAVSSWLGRLVDGGVSTTLDFFRGPFCRSPRQTREVRSRVARELSPNQGRGHGATMLHLSQHGTCAGLARVAGHSDG